ncbi:XRE family transcriptional regulator [Streptomyces mashuensis]|nr:XRE family transcriptional regulator [Streptomyces mashuensis]
MEGNELLKRRMAEAGYTQMELANKVSLLLIEGGRAGTVGDRTVRNWVSGRTRWPHPAQRAALEAIFACSAEELGFTPPRTTGGKAPVHRRNFMTVAAATALAVSAPAAAASRRVGLTDVERLHRKFAAIIANDHKYGGRTSIEVRACDLAGEAMLLQSRGDAGQHTRRALYGCAAGFMSSAMWAATDGRRFEAAQRHLDRAAGLAAMSGDQTIQFRIWSHAGSLYRHLGRPTDALAANDVARGLPVARRDPVFACLGHARQAAIHGVTGNRQGVRRALGHAREAWERADMSVQRPAWLRAVCNRAEVEELALSAYLSLGDYPQAEAHAHRSLALLGPSMQRDRAIVTARLAIAQLCQGDVEAAVRTAMSVTISAEHPRVADILRDFGRRLSREAPGSAQARAWNDFERSIGGTT